MGQLDHLFAQNRAWAEAIRARDPEFFPKLSRQQSPEYLWIGCSDSRVPANEIVNLLPGRAVRPPKHRQRRGAHGPELPLGDAVRGRCAEGEAHHRLRALRLQRRAGRAPLRPDRAGRQLAAARAGRRREAPGLRPRGRRGDGEDEPPLRAERHRAGGQRLPDDDPARRLGTGPGGDRARLDLRAEGRLHPEPRPGDLAGSEFERQYRAALAAVCSG